MSDPQEVMVDIPVANGNGRPSPPQTVESQGTPVVFQDLTYSVMSNSNKGEKVSLLKNLSGCFSPRQMSALMGPSGSGKTTLLDVLAGRKTQGETTGDILFSAQKPSINFLRRFTGYVEQFDTLLDILTVREMLLYTAEMKRPVEEPISVKEAVVDKYIEVLGLEVCKDTKIGNNMNRGISGGQAKRTNVALAMVVNPRVLFLDEPTSGLDSYTSNETMTVVKSLVNDGVTICATIHSPSPYTFALFDRLLVLVRGECVYHGPNGPQMINYFKNECGVPPTQSSLSAGAINNDADYLTDLVVGADRSKRYTEYSAAYTKSPIRQEMMEIVTRYAKKDTMDLSEADKADLRVNRATTTPLWKGFATLVKYRTTRNYRNLEFLGPRLGDKVICTFLIGTLYLGIGDKFRPDNYINIGAVLFMWCSMPAFGAASYVPALALEKPLYVRERNDGLYRPITYLLAKLFDELFITLIASVVFSVCVWYLIQLQGSFILFWLVYLLTLSIGIMIAYFIAIISPNMDVANAALPAYVVTLLFFAGFLIRFDDMPKYWQWYAYINILRYAWAALMINQFDGETEDPGGPISLAGSPIREYFGHDEFGSSWEALGYESLFFVAMFGMAWAALQFGTMNKR